MIYLLMYITFHLMDQTTVLLGIIFIRGGSSWCTGSSEPEVIAAKAVKGCIRDWKHLFKFTKDDIFPVHLFDITKCQDGWYAEGMEVYDTKTKKPAKFLKTLKVAK